MSNAANAWSRPPSGCGRIRCWKISGPLRKPGWITCWNRRCRTETILTKVFRNRTRAS